MFCISFVVVTVRARVASLDPALEEAGRDLYASPAQVFWRITFPLLLPGIIAAALLSFALSFDDFIITNFNSGAAVTFPKYVYTAAARGIPAQANVIASAVFLIAIIGVVHRRRSRPGIRRKRLGAERAVSDGLERDAQARLADGGEHGVGASRATSPARTSSSSPTAVRARFAPSRVLTATACPIVGRQHQHAFGADLGEHTGLGRS